MAKAKTTKPRKKKDPAEKVKQGYLDPEMAPVSIPEIDMAAELYLSARNERMELTEAESSRSADLISAMHDAKLKRYEFDNDGTPFVVDLLGTEKVSVKKKKTPKAADGGEFD